MKLETCPQFETSVKPRMWAVVKTRAECGLETQLKSQYCFSCFYNDIVAKFLEKETPPSVCEDPLDSFFKL